jgi:hypothetical protein
MAAPIGSEMHIVRQADPLREGAILTDVGSVKQAVIRDLGPHVPPGSTLSRDSRSPAPSTPDPSKRESSCATTNPVDIDLGATKADLEFQIDGSLGSRPARSKPSNRFNVMVGSVGLAIARIERFGRTASEVGEAQAPTPLRDLLGRPIRIDWAFTGSNPSTSHV